MENHEFITKIINELILEGFYIKKENFQFKNLSLNDLINENAYNEKCPNIKLYKVLYGGGNICGFYALFYTINYIKYIINNRDIYYLYKNTLRKQFFKFYKNFLRFFISEMTSLENFEIDELNKGSSLERHHLDFIIKNNLIFKYMGNKYKSLIEEYINIKKYKFEFEWFDFIENNFALDELSKIKKLNNIFNEIIQYKKSESPPGRLVFLYIGLTEHWILIIYDSFNKNNFIEMDSYSGMKDIINLKYLDKNEINKFINKVNDEIAQLKRDPLNKYQIKQFNNSIYDTQRLLYKLNNILLSNEYSLGISIMEEKCASFLENFEILKFNKNDKLRGLRIIHNWFEKEYQPKWIKEDFFDLMKGLGISKNNCENLKIRKFFELIEDLRGFLNENINLIKQNDILLTLNEGIKIFEEINFI